MTVDDEYDETAPELVDDVDGITPDGDGAARGRDGVDELDPELEALLQYLRANRGFDFTRYKRASLTRRIRRRVDDTGTGSYSAYLDLLEAEPGELTALLDTVLINVTSFFRDTDFWDALRTSVVPTLLARRAEGTPLRVWSAGCATGQEPYSLAMLFAEIIGIEQVASRLKIYATDVDEAALTVARRAVYAPHALEGLPDEYFERYFEAVPSDADLYSFNNDLRRCIIFGQHNLVSDAPISRVDLLLCRNTLMYFNSALQREVVQRLHFSVAPDGYLALGKVEMLLGHRHLFEPLDPIIRIFRKVANGRADPAHDDVALDLFTAGQPATLTDLAFEASTVAQMIVGRDGRLRAVNEVARAAFDLRRTDIGRNFRDLDVSYRPTELRVHIDDAFERGEQITIRDVPFNRSANGAVHHDIVLTPLATTDDAGAVAIAFIDVSRHFALQQRLEETRQDLETAYEEMQSTNEELETTNEELQSTNEELETTNEELQSTIEELETTNEELRSTNEEFETMNDELQHVNDQLAVRNRTLHERSAELDEARAYMMAVLNNVAAGIVVVDADLRTITWSSGAAELWGVHASEAEGRSLLGLDIGLPVDQLAAPIRSVLSRSESKALVQLDAHNRRGRPITCRVECSPMIDAAGHVTGVVLVMEGADG